MKRSGFSQEQLIAILKVHEAGVPTADVCRRHGVSSATFYKWKAKFGGPEVSDAFACGRRLRIFEVIDDFTRWSVRLIADTSISGLRAARELDWVIAERARPAMIVSDNSTEFTSMAILRWSKERDVE